MIIFWTNIQMITDCETWNEPTSHERFYSFSIKFPYRNITINYSFYIFLFMRSIRSEECRLLCWLIEVIFLLEFYYYIYLLFIFIFVRYLGGMVPPCRHTQSPIKGINIEGCKIPIGSDANKQRNTRL